MVLGACDYCGSVFTECSCSVALDEAVHQVINGNAAAIAVGAATLRRLKGRFPPGLEGSLMFYMMKDRQAEAAKVG